MDHLDMRVIERQAQICKALGNPKRLQIVYLLQTDEMTAGDLASALETTPANVSQHLAAMKQAGLVQNRREASNVIYWLTHPSILDACAMVKTVLADQMRQEQELIHRAIK